MNIDNNKLKYIVPKVDRIDIDKEISLVLESAPPEGPNEEYSQLLEFTKGNLFKIDTI